MASSSGLLVMSFTFRLETFLRLRGPGLNRIQLGIALHARLGQLRRVFAKLALRALG